MNKEELVELRGRISKLNYSEKVRIFEELNNGKEYDFNSGYATIDRPWQKNYKMDEFYKIYNDKTIYQDVLSNNQKYLNDDCIEFFGAKIKYKDFFKNIDNTAKSLSEYNIKKGDFVTICCAGIPELIYTVYALAKIGAVANLMAPYFDPKQLSDRIRDCESDTLIVLDSFYPKIKDALSDSGIKKIIVIPILNSSPLRFFPKKNEIKLNYKNELYWNQFIKDGNNHEIPKTFEYEKDYPLCMVYSSGTTGASKAILLSHDSFQYSVLSYAANKFDVKRGSKMYQIIPPWYSTGLNTSIHLGLHTGVIVFQDPRFERDVFVKNIIKHNIEYVVAPTSMFEGFLDEKLIKGKKIKALGNPFEGGEPLPYEVKTQIEANWKKMGCNSKLTAGYGQCECGATVTSPSQYVEHHNNSVALPIPGVIVTIVDDNFNELKYGERGNIVVSTPCGMIEYYKNPEATAKYFHYDEYGRKWNCTGDIGYMAPNGDLFIEGRGSDYTIIGNKKIYNFDIEKPILKLNDIQNCDCLSKKNKNKYQELALHIIFDEEYRKKYANQTELINKLCEIQKIIFNEYGDIDMVPNYFKIRESFPYKPSGKRDIESLSEETENFIYVDSKYLIDDVNIKVKKKI